MQARKADWSVRRAAARLETDDTSGAIRPRAEQVSLFARRLWLAASRRWVDLRATKTLELYDRRKTMDAPLDRWTTSFWFKAMVIVPGDGSIQAFGNGSLPMVRPLIV